MTAHPPGSAEAAADMAGPAYAWVIERGDSQPSAPTYWGGHERWSQVHMDAVRFARKQDAERVACRLGDGYHRVAEHAWVSDAAAPARQDAQAPAAAAHAPICPRCHGEGYLGPAKTPDGEWFDQPCPLCNGSGKASSAPPASPTAPAPSGGAGDDDAELALLRLLDLARKARDEARAEVARLRLALEPFAKAAEKWNDVPGTFTSPDVQLWQNGERVDYITVGNLRNARAALNATPPAPAAAREADLLPGLERALAVVEQGYVQRHGPGAWKTVVVNDINAEIARLSRAEGQS